MPRYHTNPRQGINYLSSLFYRYDELNCEPEEVRRGSDWLTFQYGRDSIPPWSACYVIFLDGKLTYIGSSENVRTRLSSHLKWYRKHQNGSLMQVGRLDRGEGELTIVTPWGNSDNVRVKVKRSRAFGDWLMVESRLILRLQPSGNMRGVCEKWRAA